MTRLDRAVVFALGLSAASAGLAWHAASPGLLLLQTTAAQVEQRPVPQLLKRIGNDADRFDGWVSLAAGGGRGPATAPALPCYCWSVFDALRGECFCNTSTKRWPDAGTAMAAPVTIRRAVSLWP
jgi:hypothetical protein